jgi:hypothetical protein
LGIYCLGQLKKNIQVWPEIGAMLGKKIKREYRAAWSKCHLYLKKGILYENRCYSPYDVERRCEIEIFFLPFSLNKHL